MSFLERNGFRLHYETLGDGKPVVLIHGLGANMAFWYMGLGRALARTHQVVMYDLRGHGRTGLPTSGFALSDMVGDLLALLDHLGHQDAHIVGHSFGARVALCFSGMHPDRTASLSVIDTQLQALQAPTRLSDWPHWPKWRADLSEQGMTEFPPDDAIIDFRLLSKFSDYGKAHARKRVSLRRRDMGVQGNARWGDMMQNTAAEKEFSSDVPLDLAFLRGIPAPTLLLYGEASHCLPTAERLATELPKARLILVPGAGHFVPAVKPMMVNRAVQTFVSASEAGIAPRLWQRGRMRRLRRRDATHPANA